MISRTHPIVKRLRALRTDRALRDREGVLVGEGLHLAEEALTSGATIGLAVASPKLRETDAGRALASRLEAAGAPLHEGSDDALDTLTDARAPQPVVVLVTRRRRTLDDVVRGAGGVPLLVVACGIQDPGNLGAIVRVAEAAGGTGLVATPGSADLFHPRAVRASAGSILRLRAVERGLDAALDAAAGSGLGAVGADPHAGIRYDELDWRRPWALVLGAEGAGLPAGLEGRLTARVRIPMRAPVDSLSVASAAAVLLFEAARRRSTPGG